MFEKSKGCLRVEVRHVVRMIKGWGARGGIMSVMGLRGTNLCEGGGFTQRSREHRSRNTRSLRGDVSTVAKLQLSGGGEEIKDEGERRASDGTRGVQDGGMLGKRKEREDVEGQNVRREKRAESERAERG